MLNLKQTSLWAALFLLFGCGNDGETTRSNADTATIKNLDSLPPDLSDLRFCTEKLPYPQHKFTKLYQVDTIYHINNKLNKTDTILKKRKGQEKPYIISLNGYVWNKNILQVKFIDGDQSVQSRVQQCVKEWERACAVKFIFGDFPDPDITISFKDQGYWSYIGIDSKGRVPSMSLTGVSVNMSDIDFNGVVLHEFGHALGFVHEHQNPSFNIPWDIDRVERYYRVKYGWSPKMVHDNIIFKYEFSQVNGSAFDSNSIMVYAIPKGLMKDRNYSIDWTYTLSDEDKRVVAQRYH